MHIGGAFALQFQAIQHENKANKVLNADGVNLNQLYDIGNNFNLATANLDLNVELYDGVNLHLRTFLSSRHHNEAYVKAAICKSTNWISSKRFPERNYGLFNHQIWSQ